MALALTKIYSEFDYARSDNANLRTWIGTVAFDNSYPTGGEVLTAPDGITTIYDVVCEATVSYRFVWDAENSKILVYFEDQTSGVHAQVSNAGDLSALDAVRIKIVGV